jgi:transcriptional regulator with XRE-family HTH domain
MRNFRLKHKISLQEIANAVGKSQQWVSKVELGKAPATIHNRYYMMLALQQVVLNRKREADALEDEFRKMKTKILEEEFEWIDQ